MPRDLWKIVAAGILAGPFLLAVAPALIVALALYALCNIPGAVTALRRISKDPQAMTHRTRRALRLTGWIVAGILIVGVLLYYLESYIIPRGNVQVWHFWFQILTGNWSSPPSELSPFILSLSILIALVLNFASLGLFTWLLKRIATVERIQAMKLEDALRFRDETIIGVIVHSFPEHEQERVKRHSAGRISEGI